jgi:hypothetical protein
MAMLMQAFLTYPQTSELRFLHFNASMAIFQQIYVLYFTAESIRIPQTVKTTDVARAMPRDFFFFSRVRGLPTLYCQGFGPTSYPHHNTDINDAAGTTC